MSEKKTPYQTIVGLQTHPLWIQLTVKQRKFVLTYLETNGDKVAAIKASYTFKDEVGADVQVSRLLANRNIRTLLEAYFGHEVPKKPLSKTEAEELLSERLRDRKIPASFFLGCMRLYFMLKGWAEFPEKLPNKVAGGKRIADAQIKSVNDIVRQLEEAAKGVNNGQPNENDGGQRQDQQDDQAGEES